MSVECMIDCETYGLPPDGMMISIGAVMFDPDAPELILSRYHVAIDPESYLTNRMDKLFSIHPGTVKWWMHPDQDAGRAAWNAMPKVDLASALAGFLMWYGNESVPTWSNAVTFDVVLMKHAFEALHLEAPWKFWNERCHRTLKAEAPPEVAKFGFSLGIRQAVPGVLHNALFDAEVQAYQNAYCRRMAHWQLPSKSLT